MYGVQLVVSGDEPVSTQPVEQEAPRPATTKVKARKRASTAKEPKSSQARTAVGRGRTNGDSVSRSGGSPGNVEVRAWARRNGLAVADRGRVAGSVMAAYVSANNK